MTNVKLLILIVTIVILVCHADFATPAAQTSTEWQLVWSDEFDYSGLPDPKKWGYDVGGHGWGNKELQFYTSARKENARVENGNLIIEARKDGWENHEYTSARLVSKNKGDWTYGRVEVRAKLPTGLGTWPAIWMLPTQKDYGGWPDGGEIDIMEHVGFDPDVVHASVHTRAYYHSIGTQKTAKINVPTARTGFNTYAVEWTPEEIRAFVNEKHYFTFKNERLTSRTADYKEWPFDKPFHLLLNIAVGGTWGGAKGVDQKIWPQRMEVDYVRVYQAKPVQKEAPKNSNAQAEADKLERQEQRQQLISYLDGIAQKAVAIEPVDDRVRVLIEVSDAFSYLDKQRAVASFTQLFQSFDNIEAEPNKINFMRQAVLARIASRDPQLAAKLITAAPAPPASPTEKWSRELNAMGTPYSETLITVALSLLKTDFQHSIFLAQFALREGMSQTTRIYLHELRAMNQAAADSLLEMSLRHAPRRSPRLFDALAYWEYAFQPGAFHFGPVTWPRGAEVRSYEVSQALKLLVLEFAVASINQNMQLRLSTENANTTETNIRMAQLYSVIQQLLPDIAAYIPRAADALRGELGALEQTIRGAGQPLPALRTFGSTPEATSNAVESLLYKAERTTGGKERDELYLAAAYRLLFDSQFEKATSIASRIDELELRNSITDAINFNWIGSMLASGNTTEALTLARTIRAPEPRIVALAKIGAVLATKDDAVTADENLNESQTLAAKATPSAVVSAAVLHIALARANDATRAFEALALAVSIVNKTNADALHWQMLNAKSLTTPLKTASLNSTPSSGGGMKSIRVTYPRLAGLSEVFAVASRHDLHQAMRVAQDLSSKALSLAVQATVCRATAERLEEDQVSTQKPQN